MFNRTYAIGDEANDKHDDKNNDRKRNEWKGPEK